MYDNKKRYLKLLCQSLLAYLYTDNGFKSKNCIFNIFQCVCKITQKRQIFFRNFPCIFPIKKTFYIWYKEMTNTFFPKYSYGNIWILHLILYFISLKFILLVYGCYGSLHKCRFLQLIGMIQWCHVMSCHVSKHKKWSIFWFFAFFIINWRCCRWLIGYCP